jgi:hypothetical protein
MAQFARQEIDKRSELRRLQMVSSKNWVEFGATAKPAGRMWLT